MAEYYRFAFALLNFVFFPFLSPIPISFWFPLWFQLVRLVSLFIAVFLFYLVAASTNSNAPPSMGTRPKAGCAEDAATGPKDVLALPAHKFVTGERR